MTTLGDRQALSFRDSVLTFALVVGAVALLSVGLLILLDPRAQAFWGARASELGTAVRALVDQLPRAR